MRIPGRALADARLVDEDNQATFALGFFEPRPSVPLPLAHRVFVALNGAALGFLR